MTPRYIRWHSTDYMHRLGELRHITEPVAVVIRPDGSIDVYGDVAVIDQASHDQPHTRIVGQDDDLHEHRYSGQVLRHTHAGGHREHGYYEHPEDGPNHS
jgi:hypothetical protein